MSRPDRQRPASGAGDLKDRRRAIQRAIRRREDPPAGLEDLAMQVALRQSGLRWFVVLYAVGFVVEVVSAFVENSLAAQVRDGLIALAFLVLGNIQWQVGQRAREAVDRWSAAQEKSAQEQAVREQAAQDQTVQDQTGQDRTVQDRIVRDRAQRAAAARQPARKARKRRKT